MAYTSPAFVARMKKVTRRNWKDSYAESWSEGEEFKAFSQTPRCRKRDWDMKGIHILGTGHLTQAPFKARLNPRNVDGKELVELIMQIYIQEGFAYLDNEDHILLAATHRWVQRNDEYWVVPYKVDRVKPRSKEIYTQPDKIARARERLLMFLPD